MKRTGKVCLFLAALLLVFSHPAAYAEETGNRVFVPGEDSLLLEQEDIQVILKGDSFGNEFEGGTVRLKAEVRNGTDQDLNVWYSGRLNGQEINENGWYLGTVSGHFSIQAFISNQEPNLTIMSYEDLNTLQLHFLFYDLGGNLLFEADSERILFESGSKESALDEIASETSYTECSGAELTDFLRSVPGNMETVTTDAREEMLQLRFSEKKEDQMIGSFSVYSPTVTGKEVSGVLLDLPSAADWLVFELYDFQRENLKDYTDQEPISLKLLNECMKESWESFRGLDFAAGCAKDGNTAFYWMPVYYEKEEQGFLNDEVYLYLYAVTAGADSVFLEDLGVYYPVTGDFRAEQFLITDRETVVRFLELLRQELDLENAGTEQEQYETLVQDSQGEDVRAIQKRLLDLGYLTSSVDGYYGPMTQEAVKAFQEDEGLEATGEADARTQYILLAEKEERAMLNDWLERFSEG